MLSRRLLVLFLPALAFAVWQAHLAPSVPTFDSLRTSRFRALPSAGTIGDSGLCLPFDGVLVGGDGFIQTPEVSPPPLLATVGRVLGSDGSVLIGEDRPTDRSLESADGAESLLRRGRVLESQGRLEDARRCLERAVLARPDDPEPLCRLAKVFLYLKEYERSSELLRQARGISTSDPLVDAVEGLYLFCLRDTPGAISRVDRAIKSEPGLKEAYLIKADILFAVRDLEGAGRLLSRFLERFPSDPEGLYLAGIVSFYRRDLRRSQAFLEESLNLNPRAINVRKDLVQVYSLTGSFDRALSLVEGLLSERPQDKALTALRSGLRERLRLNRDGRVLVVGPFRFAYPKDTSSGTLDCIVTTFTTAHKEMTRYRDVRPDKVRVTILNQTDQLLPAYYNHVSDEITISRQYYENLDTDRKRELGRHLIFHEFSHLVFYHELGDLSLPPAALWLVEGLAEYEAGGYTYTHVDYGETFADGLLDLETLEEYLPVSAMAKGKVREKAYIQSYAMVAYLMDSLGSAKGLARIRQMALAYTRHGPDHERVVGDCMGMSPRDFLATCNSFLGRLVNTTSGETSE